MKERVAVYQGLPNNMDQPTKPGWYIVFLFKDYIGPWADICTAEYRAADLDLERSEYSIQHFGKMK